jgi:RNA polymerase sigma-70 factor (ECF subfamily)
MIDELTDAELVKQIQAGNTEAMSIIYRRHRPAIFRYVFSKVYDHQQAQDIASEIFLRMVAYLPQYQITGAPFRAWLFRIAHNYTITYAQKAYAQQLMPLSYADNTSRLEDNPALAVEHKLKLEWVAHGLQQLDETQREVLILRFLIGLPLKDVALALDKTVGAIKTLQHRGILALRVALQSA